MDEPAATRSYSLSTGETASCLIIPTSSVPLGELPGGSRIESDLRVITPTSSLALRSSRTEDVAAPRC